MPALFEPRFEALLHACGRDDVPAHTDVHMGVWPDGVLAGFNQAWATFAQDNRGASRLAPDALMGSVLWNAMAPVLATFYRQAYEAVLRTGTAWEHTYECSSERLFRVMRMRVERLVCGPETGLLVHHSTRHVAPQPDIFPTYPTDLYERAAGSIQQCAHCRRTRRVHEPVVWDWVPAWVAQPPPQVEYMLCARCRSYHHLAPEAVAP